MFNVSWRFTETFTQSALKSCRKEEAVTIWWGTPALPVCLWSRWCIQALGKCWAHSGCPSGPRLVRGRRCCSGAEAARRMPAFSENTQKLIHFFFFLNTTAECNWFSQQTLKSATHRKLCYKMETSQVPPLRLYSQFPSLAPSFLLWA